jgi:hypothetical protein
VTLQRRRSREALPFQPFLEHRMVERELQQRIRRFPPLDRPRKEVGDVIHPGPNRVAPVIIPASGPA